VKTEFRIRWKRVGLRPKSKTLKSRRAADRFVLQLGPEPWKAWGKDPHALVCCSGYQCGCMGATVGEEALAQRATMPVIEWIEVSVRSVSVWVEESWEPIPDGRTEMEPVRTPAPSPF
jgi:hypothetical protein